MFAPATVRFCSTRLLQAFGVSKFSGFHSSTSLNMPIKEGDKLPSVDLHEGDPHSTVNIADLFKGKKGIIIAVPGAFTPNCHKTHLPEYVADYDKFKAKGIEVIACVSVNDAFVMAAWGDNQGTKGKVRMLADTTAEFTKAVDLTLDATPLLGNVRSKRYSMLVQDGVVKKIHVEPDSIGLTCSLSNALLSEL